MKKICSLLTLLTVIVVSVGFYRGWFAVSDSREAVSHKVDVNLTVDPDKVKEDAETVKDKAAELTGKTTEGTSP
ncbi:MAG: hypothetical protein FD138_3711 [Planctomycetota bacterium]|nr:MAG: hypothetical protein FD138_3711 [Planctomycetota bacterium]